MGSETNKYELERRRFTDYLACQEWCNEDVACVAVVVTSGNCIKLASENVNHPLLGTHLLLFPSY